MNTAGEGYFTLALDDADESGSSERGMPGKGDAFEQAINWQALSHGLPGEGPPKVTRKWAK